MALPTVTVAGQVNDPSSVGITGTVWFTNTAEIVDSAGNVLVPNGSQEEVQVTGGVLSVTLYASDAGTVTVPYAIRELWRGGREFTVNLLAADSPISYADLGPVSPAPAPDSPYALASDLTAESTAREAGDAATLAAAEAYTDAHGGTAGVSSFNTRTGAVTLSKADVTGTGLAATDVGADASGAAAAAQAASLQKTANLSDLGNSTTARTNLGLGTAATHAATDFDTAGAAAAAQAASVPTTRTVNGHALSANVTVSKADVGLGNADNTSDANKPVSTAQQTALDAKADLVGGVVPTAQLPALAITDTFAVSSQAAMLALAAQRGDIAIRSDLGKSFVLSTDDPTLLANWLELSAAGKVTSVNGQQGVVTLAAADVGADASGAAATAQAASLQKASNLSDLGSAATARTNLGLGTAALSAATEFDAAGAASTAQAASLQKTANLSDVANAGTARTNLGAAATVHTHAEADVTSLTTDLAAKAPLASPAFTGTPTISGSNVLSKAAGDAAYGYVSGLIGSRPTPAAATAPWYFATDDNGGTLYRTDGSTWTKVTAGVNWASGTQLAYAQDTALSFAVTTTKTDLSTPLRITIPASSVPVRINAKVFGSQGTGTSASGSKSDMVLALTDNAGNNIDLNIQPVVQPPAGTAQTFYHSFFVATVLPAPFAGGTYKLMGYRVAAAPAGWGSASLFSAAGIWPTAWIEAVAE